MRHRNQPVEVDPPDVVLGQDDHVVGFHLPDGVHGHRAQAVDLPQISHALLLQIPQEILEDPGGALRIVHGAVVVLQGNPAGLGHIIQLKALQVRQKHTGHV